MKTFKLTVTEEEIRALISYHALSLTHFSANGSQPSISVETSERIHTLTKRLNKDTPEIEGDPRPSEPPQVEAAKTEQQSGW